MDASSDARLAEQVIRHGPGKGVVNSPNMLRSSRSMEHRAPSDAQLRLFPSYQDEDSRLQFIQEGSERCGPLLASSPAASNKPHLALLVANHLSGRDIMTDLQPASERNEAERNHIIMLNL